MTKAKEKTVRIGGASGFWGDSSVAVPQLVFGAEIDYLVFDYLAETTMAILAAARGKKPELGYATDFVDSAMKSMLPEIANISNIGVIARAPEYLPIILAAADARRVSRPTSRPSRCAATSKRYLVPGHRCLQFRPAVRRPRWRRPRLDAPRPAGQGHGPDAARHADRMCRATCDSATADQSTGLANLRKKPVCDRLNVCCL
jgi:hypothetical protein